MSHHAQTFHLHIQGIVQGVGFRPFIYNLANRININGTVNNTTDGVHIIFNATPQLAKKFLDLIFKEKPEISIITHHSLMEIPAVGFDTFSIIHSNESGEKSLLSTPDYGICTECQEEIFNQESRRFGYAFTSCTNCGPRYSIIQKLPYDRDKTTMSDFQLCKSCQKEYDNPSNRRYYHQTNSCPDCPVEMTVYAHGKQINGIEQNEIIDHILHSWSEGKIIAIKGIGGYLLTCDATNVEAVKRLRKLKNRPTKPFALMYHDLFMLAEDTDIDIVASEELESQHSPIVLLSLKSDYLSRLAIHEIAPNLDQIGVMLPYTPLYVLLLKKFQKPIVGTSGNKSGMTIIYEDDTAVNNLTDITDFIVSNNRAIVVPQDDSVLKHSPIKRKRIIIRRSRGMSPSYVRQSPELLTNQTILCMGASLKSTFTLIHKNNVFISQYLGDTDEVHTQHNYRNTLFHLLNMLDAQPDHIVVDAHPGYFSTTFGKELSEKWKIDCSEIYHHEAHFWAILAENDLMNKEVTGIILDGTGYGRDKQIWGGEFFSYHNHKMERVHHLDYFDSILGDKMPREPRISALSILGHEAFLHSSFTDEEWRIYKKILSDNQLKTSSVGRLFDGAACILLGINMQHYEGEAAMQLENLAHQYFKKYGITTFYSYLTDDIIPDNFPKFLLTKLMNDIEKKYDPSFLAAKFHISLAHYIANTVKKIGHQKAAFSGGVFQNGWLVDLLHLFLEPKFELYFHQELSPNDENISFGQLHGFLNHILKP